LLRITKAAFEMLLGPMEALLKAKEQLYDDPNNHDDGVWMEAECTFAELKVKGTLGRGSYGFVQLVEVPSSPLVCFFHSQSHLSTLLH
jgi:hypothetical protein